MDIKLFHIQLGQEQPKGGIRWWLEDMGAQQLVERLVVAFGKTLHAQQRTLAAQDRKNGHQQHPPLREANPPAHAAVGQGLEETNQIRCGRRVFKRRCQGDDASSPMTTTQRPGAGNAGRDRLLMGPWGETISERARDPATIAKILYQSIQHFGRSGLRWGGLF